MKKASDAGRSTSLPQEIEIRVMVSGRVLLAIFDQATREGRSSLEVLRERIERPALLAEKKQLEDYGNGARPKSHQGAWYRVAEKWVIAMPLALKCELMRETRERMIPRNDFGLAVLRAALADRHWLERALAAMAAEKAQRAKDDVGLFRRLYSADDGRLNGSSTSKE